MTADQVVDRLVANRYEPPEWFTLREVPPDKGHLRHLDLVAWNTFASRGLTVEGVEVKVSRADWLRELKDAAKAEETFAMVERFFVAAPPDVVKAEELPPDWGLLEIRGERVFKIRIPKQRERSTYSKSEVVGILRRVQSQWHRPELVRDLKKQVVDAEGAARKSFEAREEKRREEVRRIEDELRELRAAIGIGWSADKVKVCGKFRELLERFGDGTDALASARETAERGIANLRDLIFQIEKMESRAKAGIAAGDAA